MNLILLEQPDLLASARARIDDSRFLHVRDVLCLKEGDELSVGILGGRTGRGRITELTAHYLEVELRLESDPPPPLPVTVILALPRPKVMRRALFSLTVMGVKRIFLVNANRVEKSYWQTPFLSGTSVRRQLLLGLEQAKDTILPDVHQRRLFRPFVEDELPGLSQGTVGLVAHPAATEPLPGPLTHPVTLAIGPEGGFIPYELEQFISKGFKVVSLGQRIMNIETAIPAILSRLF